MIEIYLLEHLRAFYECGTLSAAAERLHVAQPSVSRSMQKLEDILEVTLFERQKNRIILNETGKLAAEYAKRILGEEEEMKAHIKAYDRSLHTLTIGSCAPGPLMELLPTATASLPGMTLSSAMDTEDNLLKGLWNSDYGMIILAKPLSDEDFLCKEYRSEQLMLSVPPFHPAASYKKLLLQKWMGKISSCMHMLVSGKISFGKRCLMANFSNKKIWTQLVNLQSLLIFLLFRAI